jgi:hypothetical protein
VVQERVVEFYSRHVFAVHRFHLFSRDYLHARKWQKWITVIILFYEYVSQSFLVVLFAALHLMTLSMAV